MERTRDTILEELERLAEYVRGLPAEAEVFQAEVTAVYDRPVVCLRSGIELVAAERGLALRRRPCSNDRFVDISTVDGGILLCEIAPVREDNG